jgi:hypothetical protein
MGDEDRNWLDVSGQSRSVVPTVYLVGIDELERIPEFLDLGLIVVVSPDLTTLRQWKHEQGLAEPLMDRSTPEPTAVVVEMNGGWSPTEACHSLSGRARDPQMLAESAHRIPAHGDHVGHSRSSVALIPRSFHATSR